MKNDQPVIQIKGAREHNLKDIDLTIPKNKLVVFTGLSGSGKSSLAFDTLYAEGQRRYVESLSSYARQFLGLMSKPDIDSIEGLSPAISIDQKTTSNNPRSTVGTITEIYDYLRLLFARIGHPHCPQCDREVTTQSIDQIVNQVIELSSQQATSQPARLLILSPIVRDKKGEFKDLFENLQKKGYSRLRIDGKFYQDFGDLTLIKTNKHSIQVVIDRLVISAKQLKDDESIKTFRSRLTQSVEEALRLADGIGLVAFIQDQSLNFPEDPQLIEEHFFSEKRACTSCGLSISELEPRLFSFNSPQGACPKCNGLGSILKIDQSKIIAPTLTLSEGAIVPFARMMSHDTWWARLVKAVVAESDYDFRTTPWHDIDEKTQQLLLHGSEKVYQVEGENRYGRTTTIHEKFEGFITNLHRRYQETDSEYIRKEIETFMTSEICPVCDGTRLTKEALGVVIDHTNIAQLTSWPIHQTYDWINQLSSSDNKTILTEKELAVATIILKEISERLKFLNAVGLDYLTLDRRAGSLAGGEAQRIRLASQIGTGLTGVLYILDEPTIGLHQRDNHRLIKTLQDLKNKGNTVIVVEHDRDVMLAADYIVDFGPLAGHLGGEIVFQGTSQQLITDKDSLTGKYLSRKKDVTRTKKNQTQIVSDDEAGTTTGKHIKISGASHHNLKKIDVDFPLHKLISITGVSGSGKSTLLHDTLYNHLAKNLGRSYEGPGPVENIMIPDEVKRVTLIDQSPIGKTPRSNPATYTKVFDYIRKIFANTKESQIRGYNAGRFSFNVKGGRCETCKGDGQIKIEMQFLPDVYVTCDVCHGSRYNQETLEIKYNQKNIAQVLDLSVDEAVKFFSQHSTLRKKLKTLQEVGLGYIKLGQPAPTLSGGEAQRIKLAKELSTRTLEHVVYLLDEPTTGLHFADIQKLLNVLNKLAEQNNTVILIEHNLDIIKNSDWIIDLGPEGGEKGGQVIATGTPGQIINNKNSFTGKYLKEEVCKE